MTTDTSDHDEENPHGPGVRLHPPVIYAISILSGIGLDNLMPLVMPFSIHGRFYGGAVFAIAVIVAGFSIREFHNAKTDVRPDKPDSALITSGPYRYSRNPLYLVLTLAQVTVALWINNAWVLVMTIPSVLVIRHYAIAKEEVYLEKLFGQTYLDYKQKVRRWL